MQPLNDDELRRVLREWDAPAAPSILEQRVLGAATPSPVNRWLQWLATGSIRIPVPVGIAAVLVLVFLAVYALEQPRPVRVNLAEFQPVKELKPRIIRSSHEGN